MCFASFRFLLLSPLGNPTLTVPSSAYAVPQQMVMSNGMHNGNPNGHNGHGPPGIGGLDGINGQGMNNGHEDDGAFAQQLS